MHVTKMVVKRRSPGEALKCCSAVCVTMSSVAHWDKPWEVKISDWNYKRLAGLHSSSVKSMNSYNLTVWVPGIKTGVHVISWLMSITKFPLMYPVFLHCSGQSWGIEDRDADCFERPFCFLLENHSLFNAKPGAATSTLESKNNSSWNSINQFENWVDNWYNFDREVINFLRSYKGFLEPILLMFSNDIFKLISFI